MIELLKNRFAAHPERHPDIRWSEVEERLRADSYYSVRGWRGCRRV